VSVTFERSRLTEQVVGHLTRLITQQTWPAGTALPPEGELAQQLGVSRTVVREGVRVLSSRGMLDVRQGRGTYVMPTERWNATEPLALLVQADRSSLLDWLEVRTILETESARLAAERLDDGGRATLDDALGRLEAGAEDPERFAAADIHFHLSVAAASGNAALVRLLHPVVQPLRAQLHETTRLLAARRRANEEHRGIAMRIMGGDPTGARAAMAAHLGRVVDEISQVLAGRVGGSEAGDEADI